MIPIITAVIMFRGTKQSIKAFSFRRYVQAVYVASSDSAVGGGQPVFDIRTVRDHFDQRPVDIATALGCVPLAAMLDPSLPLHLATVGDGSQVRATAI